MQYTITRKYIKNIIIRVDKHGDVKVSAPHWVKGSDIERFVQSKNDWIESRKDKILRSIVRYENGAIVRFFDEEFVLRITDDKRSHIKQYGSVLEVFSANIKKSIVSWYKIRSKDDIDRIVNKYKSAIDREVEHISFRDMTTRWGSCNYKRATITLNTRLFSKPRICFEYVLLHELIHLIHPNHGKGFYDMLDSLMPRWRDVRAMLEN